MEENMAYFLSSMVLKHSKLNPENPRAIYVKAWEMYKTPKMWGGDKEAGKQLAAKSLALLQNEQAGIQPHLGESRKSGITG